MLSKTMRVGGRTFSWLEAGAGEPLVLLHAFPLNAQMWTPQLESPPPGWQIIAPNLRGFGVDAPSNLPEVLTIDDYAADIVDLLDALHIREAAIGGLSMGGYVTFAMLRLAPRYFRALVLADTRATADSEAARAGRVKMQALVDDEGAHGVAHEMLPKLVGATTMNDRPEVVARVRSMIEAAPAAAITHALGALMTRPDSTSLLADIRRPVLVLVGDEDAITPRSEAEAMHRAIPGAVLKVIPGAGHLSNFEVPHDFTRELASFLDARV
jgi:3-oxoadipate enol-lactonase